MNLLLIAYKIEADKGSEDGTGYHLARAIIERVDQVTLLTRTNNVDKLLGDPAFANVKVIGVDVSKWLGFFKRGGKGVILFYYLWQIFAGLKVRELRKKERFDVIHQLNFHATWAAHFLFGKKQSRIVWGPLTHHQEIPERLWFGSLWSYWSKEKFKNGVKRMFWFFDPFLLWAVKRSDAILYSAQHLIWPFSMAKERLKRMTYGGSAFPTSLQQRSNKKFNILFIGRFVDLKGCVIAMKACKNFAENLPPHAWRQVSITFIGEGERYTDMAAYAQIIQSSSNIPVELLSWQPQTSLWEHYQNASIFLFPSFEGQGLVVAEALAHGCQVICYHQTGPHDLAGETAITVQPTGSADQIAITLADRLRNLFDEYQNRPDLQAQRAEAAFERAKQLDWSLTADRIIEAYHA